MPGSRPADCWLNYARQESQHFKAVNDGDFSHFTFPQVFFFFFFPIARLNQFKSFKILTIKYRNYPVPLPNAKQNKTEQLEFSH